MISQYLGLAFKDGPNTSARPTVGFGIKDSNGRTIFVADAHRGDGQRFIVRADEKLTAFVELESATRGAT